MNEVDKLVFLSAKGYMNLCVHTCKTVSTEKVGYPEINKSFQEFVLLIFIFSSKQS